jgi:hypothetical protein
VSFRFPRNLWDCFVLVFALHWEARQITGPIMNINAANIDAAKARSIFTSAIENHAPDQWGKFLDDACGDGAAMRGRVVLLLQAHQGDDSFLDRGEDDPAADNLTIDQARELPGTSIGRYKLLEQVGEGGMGVVYVAEQTEPVRRRVALKIIKPGMDTKQVIARFEAERQALAMMDHPNIAKILDGGMVGPGRRTGPESPTKRLASPSGFDTVKVWDAETGREVASLQHTTAPNAAKGKATRPPLVNGLAFSPDSKRLLSTSAEATKVWDVETGRELRSMKGTAMISGVAFSPDGTRLASSINVGPGGVGEVVVRDVETGTKLLTLNGHTASVSSIVFSPNGKRLASAAGNPTGGNSGEVKIWDADSGLELLTIKGGGYRHSVAFSPDGNWLVSCARGALRIYNATPLAEKP